MEDHETVCGKSFSLSIRLGPSLPLKLIVDRPWQLGLELCLPYHGHRGCILGEW